MILAFDTFYFDDKAKTVCLAFDSWGVEHYTVYSEVLEGVAPYTPGEFYKRELPCILSLLRTIGITDVAAIVIDGYVFLDDDGKPGLGSHLYETLNRQVPVIGVAKTAFATLRHAKRDLLRGRSQRPLYITSAGIDLNEATEHIRRINGESRIPTLLKLLDRLTREI